MAKRGLKLCPALFVFLQIVAIAIAEKSTASNGIFENNVFKAITAFNRKNNVIYSPASIQSCLTLAYLGADGKSADELRSALKLDADFGTKPPTQFLESHFQTQTSDQAVNDDDVILKMANRIYVNQHYTLVPTFGDLAMQFFGTGLELTDFSDATAAVKKINKWVENQTANKIIDILSPENFDNRTSMVLVNAIYFKGKWKNPFDMRKTYKDGFYLNANDKVEIDYMTDRMKEVHYAELTDLDAKAIQLPYKNSDLFMLFILPNKVNGLKKLESALANVDLNELSKQLIPSNVDVHIPKFRIEFELNLIPILHKLGIHEIFSDRANFSKIFATASDRQRVSNVEHKAYLDVNESGSEAAAATVIKVFVRMLMTPVKEFYAKHPFVFAMRNIKAVFFAGHVVKF